MQGYVDFLARIEGKIPLYFALAKIKRIWKDSRISFLKNLINKTEMGNRNLKFNFNFVALQKLRIWFINLE